MESHAAIFKLYLSLQLISIELRARASNESSNFHIFTNHTNRHFIQYEIFTSTVSMKNVGDNISFFSVIYASFKQWGTIIFLYNVLSFYIMYYQGQKQLDSKFLLDD